MPACIEEKDQMFDLVKSKVHDLELVLSSFIHIRRVGQYRRITGRAILLTAHRRTWPYFFLLEIDVFEKRRDLRVGC